MGLEWLIGVKELVLGIKDVVAVVEMEVEVEGLLALNVNQAGSLSSGVGGSITSPDIEI